MTSPIVPGKPITPAALESAYAPLAIRKPSDTSRPATISTSADPALQILNVPSGRYYVVTSVIVYAADSAADLRGGLQGPTNATFVGTYRAAAVGASSTNTAIIVDKQTLTNGFAFGGVGVATDMTAFISGILYSGDGGTVSFHWAQWTSNAIASIVRAGSFISLAPIG